MALLVVSAVLLALCSIWVQTASLVISLLLRGDLHLYVQQRCGGGGSAGVIIFIIFRDTAVG